MLFSLFALGLVSAVLSAPSTTVQPESLADDSYPVPVSYFYFLNKSIGISETLSFNPKLHEFCCWKEGFFLYSYLELSTTNFIQ